MQEISLCFSDFSAYCIDGIMMKKFQFIIIFLFLSCVINLYAQEQEIDQNYLIGARNAGLGDADISSANDVSSMYENPATIVFMKHSSIFFNHTEVRDGMGMFENLAFPILPKGPQMISFGFQLFHLGYLQNFPGIRGVHLLEYGYDLAISSIITPTVSIGALAGLREGVTDNSKTWASSYLIGLDYSPSADINYAIIYKGMGNDVMYQQSGSFLSVSSDQMPNRLEIGATMSYPSSSSLRRKIFSLSMANEKVFGISGLYYKAGIEVFPFEFLSLRFGFIAGPGVSEPRYGIGFSYSNFRFEYVYYSAVSNFLQQLSVIYDL